MTDLMKNILKRQFIMFSKAGLADLKVFFQTETNKPWFAVADVAAALSGDPNRSLPTLKKLQENHPDVVISAKVEARDGKVRTQKLMDESALYTVVLMSKSEKAEAFRWWIVNEVLPSIRKEGAYIFGQENLDAKTRDTLLAETRALLAKAEERAAKAEKKVTYLKGDSDYLFEQWQKVTAELVEANKELLALKPKAAPKKSLATKSEVQAEVAWSDREGWLISVEPGKKYALRDPEER